MPGGIYLIAAGYRQNINGKGARRVSGNLASSQTYVAGGWSNDPGRAGWVAIAQHWVGHKAIRIGDDQTAGQIVTKSHVRQVGRRVGIGDGEGQRDALVLCHRRRRERLADRWRRLRSSQSG